MHGDPLAFAVLGIICGKQDGIHGYQLKAELDELCGDFWTLNYGQLYRVLAALERDGLIEGEELAQIGRPAKRIFRAQPLGRDRLDDWIASPPTGVPTPLRDELSVKLLFATADRLSDLLRLVSTHRAFYLQHLSRVKKRLERVDRDSAGNFVTTLMLLQADLRVRADMAWLDQVEAEVRKRFSS